MADKVALWLGYTVMFSAGISATSILVGLTLDHAWRTIKNANSMAELQSALQLQEAVEQREAKKSN